MPKERRGRSLSFDRSRLSPYPYRSSCSSLVDESAETIREWENTRCPVCMEHPHNAILLICSSHEKGCHPFMCDTSYRHSNCFDQFQKSFAEASDVLQTPDDVPNSASPSATVSPSSVSDLVSTRSPEELLLAGDVPIENPVKPKLACPLCRGLITGWTVMESARRFMNSKSRSCACETCDFSGPYLDLRKHARLVHPLVRPTDTDPERQRNWRRLERQRDLGDLISTLQSSIGEDMADGRTLTIDDGGWLAVFFLVRFTRSPSTSSAQSQLAVRRRRPSRRLWGETTDGTVDSRESDVESIPIGQLLQRRYVRRRLDNQENTTHDSRESDIESTPIGQLLPRRYVRRHLDNQENTAHDSRESDIESTPIGQLLPRRYVRRHLENQENTAHDSRESDVESNPIGQLPRRYVRRHYHNQDNTSLHSRSGQSPPRIYVRRRLHNQETLAHDSRNTVESSEGGPSIPRLYVRRRTRNQETARESGDESSDSG